MKIALLAAVAAFSFGAVLGAVSWRAGEQYKNTCIKYLQGRGHHVLN